MTSIIAICWNIAAVGLFVGIGGLLLHGITNHTRNLKISAKALDDLYHHATALIQDPETPASVVNFIGQIYPYAGRPVLTRALTVFFFCRVIFRMKLVEKKGDDTFAKDMKKMNAKQKEHFVEMINCGVVSCIMSDFFFAGMYLWIWHLLTAISLIGIEKHKPSPDRIQAAAVVMNKFYGGGHHGGHVRMAA